MMTIIEKVLHVEGLAEEVREKVGQALDKVSEVDSVQDDPQLIVEVQEAIGRY